MMRTLKFRVWRTGSRWENVPPTEQNGLWTGRLTGPGQWDQFNISIRADGSLFVPQRDGYPEEAVAEGTAVVMQWTGAIDRNGVEIYEGDIVEAVPVGVHRTTTRHIVTWNDQFVTFDPFGDWESDQLTVLGNIYEHPDLIPMAVNA